MSNDLVKDAYNATAKTYSEHRNELENNSQLEHLNILLPSHATTLDIGCGTGVPIDRFLISKGHSVIGIDISEEMIKLAKQNVPQATYIVKDMSHLKEGEYNVDAVVSFYAIFHTPRETHKDLLKTFHSFIKLGGFLCVTMGVDSWEETQDDFNGAPMFWSHYDSDTNRKFIEEAGFEILEDAVFKTDAKHHIFLARKF